MTGFRREGDDVRERLLAFIAEYVESNGYPPTVRECGAHVGLSSSSTVQVHLRILEEQGRLVATRRGPRTMKLEVVR